MILIEFLWWFGKNLIYYILRPIIWFITARDCRHCKHCRLTVWDSAWKGTWKEWECMIKIKEEKKCKKCPWRCHFERRKKGDK